MSGKGSSPRPIPDRETFENNFDAIFRKDKKEDKPVETTNNNKDKK
jgi:hypothetical protein